MQSAIGYFTTAPDWKVPRKISIKELIPKALKDKNYLENNHFAIYNSKAKYIEPTDANLSQVRQNPELYYVKQSSGCDNSFGLIVFRFPNIFGICLHDTPEQQLFKKQDRAFSQGCICVEHAEILADLLLKSDGAAIQAAVVHKAISSHQTKNFMFKNPIPIRVTYITCEVKKGVLITYKDVYNMDKSLEMALYNNNKSLSMK